MTPRSSAHLSGLGLQPGTLHAVLMDRLTRSLGRDPDTATQRDIYNALSMAVREELAARWLATQRRVAQAACKRVCYLSVEFLLGRSLINGLASLDGDLVAEARAALAELGHDLDRIAEEETDPGLGNGGLGRLAACYLDSLATLQFPAVGYGIRYDYGIFTQAIDEDGRQREIASSWLRHFNPWEIPRDDASYVIRFGGRCVTTQDAQGAPRTRWVDTHNIWAVAFDQLIPGNRSPTVNHLRLWSGRAIAPFDVEAFNAGRFVDASAAQVDAKNVSRLLYPDDTTPQGKELRLKQQYFFVSASLQDILAQHLAEGRSFEALSDAVAIQLNDTHPALAIVELMRLLIDEHELDWKPAWAITRRVFSYTNHTLLPEALETWPVAFFERLLPRHLQIIYLINRALLDEISARYPQEHERRGRLSLIEENYGRLVRMANLAVVGSHKVNGVAKLHSELMKRTIFRDFAELYPDRFTNVTNGIAVRRWLKQSNPGLSALLTEHLGHAWENDLEELERLQRCRRGRRVPPALPRHQAGQQGAARRGDPAARRGRCRRAFALRRAGEANPRVQTPAPQSPLRDHALQPPARESAARRRAAHRGVRRQGGAGLLPRQVDHPAHQQCRARRQRRSCHRWQAARDLPAGLRRVARAADHARRRPLAADLDRGHGSLGYRQYEARSERRAHHRHARRCQHRDPRGRRTGEHVHLRPDGGRGRGAAAHRLLAERDRGRASRSSRRPST